MKKFLKPLCFRKINTCLKYSYIERDPKAMGHLATTMLMERIANTSMPVRKYYMPSKIRVNL